MTTSFTPEQQQQLYQQLQHLQQQNSQLRNHMKQNSLVSHSDDPLLQDLNTKASLEKQIFDAEATLQRARAEIKKIDERIKRAKENNKFESQKTIIEEQNVTKATNFNHKQILNTAKTDVVVQLPEVVVTLQSCRFIFESGLRCPKNKIPNSISIYCHEHQEMDCAGLVSKDNREVPVAPSYVNWSQSPNLRKRINSSEEQTMYPGHSSRVEEIVEQPHEPQNPILSYNPYPSHKQVTLRNLQNDFSQEYSLQAQEQELKEQKEAIQQQKENLEQYAQREIQKHKEALEQQFKEQFDVQFQKAIQDYLPTEQDSEHNRLEGALENQLENEDAEMQGFSSTSEDSAITLSDPLSTNSLAAISQNYHENAASDEFSGNVTFLGGNCLKGGVSVSS